MVSQVRARQGAAQLTAAGIDGDGEALVPEGPPRVVEVDADVVAAGGVASVAGLPVVRHRAGVVPGHAAARGIQEGEMGTAGRAVAVALAAGPGHRRQGADVRAEPGRRARRGGGGGRSAGDRAERSAEPRRRGTPTRDLPPGRLQAAGGREPGGAASRSRAALPRLAVPRGRRAARTAAADRDLPGNPTRAHDVGEVAVGGPRGPCSRGGAARARRPRARAGASCRSR